MLLDRAVLATRPSQEHTGQRQVEGKGFVQEKMEMEQSGDGDADSAAVQLSDAETSGVQDWEDERDCILLDESDMGSVDRGPDHWNQRLDETLQ